VDDQFGYAIARGDFNNDGFADLAIGSPGEAIGTVLEAGMVTVLYGMPRGLSTQCTQTFSQGSAGLPGRAEKGDRFGSALATGDFNGDGFDDLAISAPGEDIDGRADVGYVIVVSGSVHGLDFNAVTDWWESKLSLVSIMSPKSIFSEAGDRLGVKMAAGDFNGDGVDDLAIGVPGQDINTFPIWQVIPDVGAVLVIYGAKGDGLNASRLPPQSFSGHLIGGDDAPLWRWTWGDASAVGSPLRAWLRRRMGCASLGGSRRGGRRRRFSACCGGSRSTAWRASSA
jgi:hypothetical protein